MVENCSHDRHWYALRVFLNKVFDMNEDLKVLDVETFVPVRIGAREKRLPLIPSVMFFHADQESVMKLKEAIRGRASIYSHLQGTEYVPTQIRDAEMEIFRLVTAQPGLVPIDLGSVRFKQGEKVRVTDGPFKGAEGWIKRVKGDKRLIVSIEGVCAVATTYIPQCFLRKIVTDDLT